MERENISETLNISSKWDELQLWNASNNCEHPLPSVADFMNGMNVEIMALIASAGFCFICICFNYYRHFSEMMNKTPKKFLSRTLILTGVYQFVVASSLLSMLVPRAVVLCDTLSHFAFLFSAYQLVWLFIDYAGGETNFIKANSDGFFNVRTLPCCCCCFCCPITEISKRKFTFIRLLLLQFVCVQGIVFIALNVIYIESAELYDRLFLFFVPVFVTSILFGVWGLNILTKMMTPSFPELNLKSKYICLQLVLMLNKIQPAIASAIVNNTQFDSPYPMTPKVYKNEIVQLIIVVQMTLLSCWALKLYKKPTNYVPANTLL